MEVVAVEGAAGDALVLAFTALLQHHLQIVCTPCLFYFGGFTGGQPSTEPSSLCTVEPFSPGGLRRLALNVRSPLVRQIATIAFHGTGAMQFEGKAVNVASGGGMGVWQAANIANIRARDVALHIGLVMLQSGTWPTDGFDVRATLAWSSAQGLISGPRGAFVWPVPHDRIHLDAQASRLPPPITATKGVAMALAILAAAMAAAERRRAWSEARTLLLCGRGACARCSGARGGTILQARGSFGRCLCWSAGRRETIA